MRESARPIRTDRPNRLARLVAVLGVACLLGAAAAQGAATPDRLAEVVPATWGGLTAAEREAGFDATGAAYAAAHYDDPDERSGRDLSVGVTDLGPYRDAALLVREADAAAGRAERIEVAGHPAFVASERSGPELDVIAGRMWIRASAFGELYDADDLRALVAELPLDAVAGLSDLAVADGATYRPEDVARGALRAFLPTELGGLPQADGFYAEVHPTGAPWGGYPYRGERGGAEVGLRVTIWDLGSVADAARERMANADAWTAFDADGRTGFVEAGVPEPRVVLYAGRFRLEAQAPGSPGVDPAWLRGALSEVDLGPLERFGEALPAPDPAFDPMAPQPDLADPERLAEALPAALPAPASDRARGEVQARVQDGFGNPYATSLARAPYPGEGEDAREWILEVRDQGLLTYGSRRELAAMPATEVGGVTVHAHPDRPMAARTVGDRFVVVLLAYGEAPDAVTERMVETLAGVDLAPLRALAGGDAD